MKKTLLSLFIIAVSIVNTSAQCTPDPTLNSTGVYFNESNIPCINEAYSETIQMSIKNDTTVNVFGNNVTVLMDSVKINSVTGIPNGMSYTCENTECKIIRNSLQTHTQTCVDNAGSSWCIHAQRDQPAGCTSAGLACAAPLRHHVESRHCQVDDESLQGLRIHERTMAWLPRP